MSFFASAQDKGNVEFGFNVGLSGSTVSDDNNVADSRTGFNAGASAEYYFSRSWGIKAKVIYDRKGYDNGIITVSDNFGTYDYSTNYKLDYFTVPVMANWHFGRKKNWYLNFGPYAGFLVSAKDSRFDFDVKREFESTDFGFAYGIGVKIPVSQYLKIFIEYDGQEGFTNIFKDNYYNNTTNSRGAFNIGLNFML